MNLLKRIAGHVYFFLGMLLFVLSMLVVFLPIWIISWLPEPRRTNTLYPVYRIWMGIFMPLVGCPIVRKGTENFKQGCNYVVVCNHNSFVDIPVSSPYIPGPNKTLAKAEMAKVPIFGIIYKAGSILVNRTEENSRRESFGKMNDMLKLGVHLCLYPEGTRNKTQEPLQKFYDGAFVTAIQAQKEILPALIINTKKILPGKPKFWAWPHTIQFHFLPAVPTEGLTLNDAPMLKNKVHSIMKDYYLKHN